MLNVKINILHFLILVDVNVLEVHVFESRPMYSDAQKYRKTSGLGYSRRVVLLGYKALV